MPYGDSVGGGRQDRKWGVEVIQRRQAAIRSCSHCRPALVSDPLVRLGVQSGEGVGWGVVGG